MAPKAMSQAAIERLITQRVNAAVEAERARQVNARGQGSNANEAGGQGGAPAVRECTFSGFMKCNPTVFHGHEGAVELSRWFEKTEMVFGISECAEARKVKFAAATLQGRALTWWNSQVATRGLEAANQIGWTEMKRLMTEEFCPIEEIQRMEHELWNLKVKDFDISAYTKRFHELVQLCPEMVPTERKKIEAYIRGLTDNIKGTVIGSKPTSLNEAVCMAHALMEQKAQARTERIAEGNKRKWESSQGGNNGNNRNNNRDNTRHNQQNNQRQGNARAMTTAPAEQGGYAGNKLLCNRCRKHHFGYCKVVCNNCGKTGHMARDCKGKAIATDANARPTVTCYNCGEKGHTRNFCPKRRDPQGEEARGRAYVIKDTEKQQGPNVVTGPVWGCDRLVIRAKVIENQIMAASAIIISSDSSDESTSTIAPVISSVAHVVETTLVASPTGLCGLVPYPGSDSDSPDEMSSPEHISPLPAISPFLCTDPSKAPDSSDGPPSQDPYFPIAPVTAPPGIRQRSGILIRPGEAIPFGRPCRTHLNGSRKLLTARKRVGPLPAHRLASRHASSRSSDHHSSSFSSSSDSSPVHSLGLDASDQAHSRSSTRDVLPRLCYPPRRAPRQSSSGDSPERPLHSSSHYVRPSCKRCRSPVDSIPSSMPASIEEDTEIDPKETEVDMELGIGDGDDVRDHDEIDPRDVRDDTAGYEADTNAGDTVEVGIDPMSELIVEEEIAEPAGEDSSDSSGTMDGIVRSFKDMPIDLDDVVRDFYHHMFEVRIDRIVRIETAQIRLEADQLIARGQRISMIERIDSLRLENLKVRAMLDIERDRVSSLRLHMSLSQEEFRQIRRDRDDARGRLRRLESYLGRRFGFRP
ncbi:putative reverse transcriptase domain-containing protein [Tanacetum coccineum]|uniref:Reverse transcriptase domain-containing protein n=1 Tax=Tanacetum coccineum TaxID=301880 RepID=A0ABQ5GDF1_9ASTR